MLIQVQVRRKCFDKIKKNIFFAEISNSTLAECVGKCFENSKCNGYNYHEDNRSCNLINQIGKFVKFNGFTSGRKCTTCDIRDWTKVFIIGRVMFSEYI